MQKCNFAELPKGELAILQLISNRLCVAVGDPHRYAETLIELDCGDAKFSAKGKTVLEDGWKALVKKNRSTKSEEKEQELPSVFSDAELKVNGAEIKEGKTTPPKHFTEDTLLQGGSNRRKSVLEQLKDTAVAEPPHTSSRRPKERDLE